MIMSMLSVGNLDNKVIASSVMVQNKSEKEANKSVKKDDKLSSKTVTILTGASALASLAIAGIMIYKSRKAKNDEVVNTVLTKTGILSGNDVKVPSAKPIINKDAKSPFNKEGILEIIYPYDSKKENIIKSSEENLNKKIADLFNSYIEDEENSPELKYRAREVVYNILNPVNVDLRKLDKDDLKAVLSFIKNPQYNNQLSAGVNLDDVHEIKVMRKLINEAVPIEKEAFVYAGLRTKNIFDNFTPYDFENHLDKDVIITNKSFLVTSRGYGDYLAQSDPWNLEKDHRDSGYILRIMLPEGTKGFDYRRCTNREDSLYGVNGLYVLPENSHLKIRNIDDIRKIIDCKYILPSV